MDQYTGFRPEKQAPLLDFLKIHFSPFADGFYEYQSLQAQERNLSYLAAMVREATQSGKPVLLGEFGWYGGGKPSFDEGKYRWASEEQQADWGRAVIEQTRGQLAGWFTWTLYDYPGAQNATELSGFLREDGTPKAWGRYFQKISPLLAKQRLTELSPAASMPRFDWDAALTDPAAGDKFREVFIQTYRQITAN